ncbi:hypothetical protein M422DRAFT_268493 [Sphaerobolus stellatus SS14]|uniref:AMP-dependent synthetase/ligase domain-containing protein n=1 Tax=Sphaerobolus stellatus (strain SS14) TaxID=990650 RepID=A0A0C9UMI5_SPHS4|nr:hypothetical protein M422DRAFT_268493 [Sphaerobolus stellatus SS14]
MFQADLFTRQMIQTLVNLHLRILDQASQTPTIPLSQLPLATPASLQKFSEWNETSRPLNQELAIHDHFCEIARLHGPDVAVVDESISLTYSKLNKRSDCLASWLIAMKFHSSAMTAYLACLKAGLAYMSLDKSLPNSRLTQMISSSGCRLVLSFSKFPLGDLIPFIDLSVDDNLLCTSANIIFPKVSPWSLSNVIFTSGSTGAPKGVMVEHLGMLNLCSPEMLPKSSPLYLAAPSFIASVMIAYLARMNIKVSSYILVRGQRVEAGDIESLINRHPSVQASAVVVLKTEAAHQLVAYIQLGDQGLLEEGVLELWDSHYNVEDPFDALEDTNASHDFARWFSMFNGERIPFEQMEESLQETFRQIEPASRDRVLEVGELRSRYLLSFSFRNKSKPEGWYRNSVKRAAAHELNGLPNSKISLAIINSVIQYFPSAHYLTHVLEQLLDILEGGVRVFLGDLRSYSLTTLHDLERALGLLEEEDTADDVRDTLNAYAESQVEFLVDPSFFFNFQRKHPSVSYVEVRPKAMKIRNELSRYRYSVVLHINSKQRSLNVSRWINFSEEKLSVDKLPSLLRSSGETTLGVSHIPQPDLVEVDNLLTVVRSSDSPHLTVHALRALLEGGSCQQFSMPTALHELVVEDGWKVALDYSNQTVNGGYLRAIFYRSPSSPSDSLPIFPLVSYEEPFTNTIKKPASDYRQVFDTIKDHL